MYHVILPRLDPEMKEGTIIEWYKKEGEKIKKGDPLAKVEGEKVIFDVEAPDSGILCQILYSTGVAIPIAQTIAIIAESCEEIGETPTTIETNLDDVTIIEPQTTEVKERLKASPAARRLAEKYNLDLKKVLSTGPGGRIVKNDVLRAVEERTKQQEDIEVLETEEIIPFAGMRKTIAERMSYSYKNIPQLAITMEIRVSKAREFIAIVSESREIRIPLTAFLTMVTGRVLKKFPIMNSIVDDSGIKILKNINIGIAIALEEGLIVPVIQNADGKELIELADEVRDLIGKAKERTLSSDELRGGTFTISNLGGFGVDLFAPIINPPQSAILGIGRIAQKPIVENKEIMIEPIMNMTLVFDHRVVDGSKAAEFLGAVKKLIENPIKLLMNGS
jgi:pyruvate dehydrogenase E2 component (dihydrolipoamide acetyltransferase)